MMAAPAPPVRLLATLTLAAPDTTTPPRFMQTAREPAAHLVTLRRRHVIRAARVVRHAHANGVGHGDHAVWHQLAEDFDRRSMCQCRVVYALQVLAVLARRALAAVCAAAGSVHACGMGGSSREAGRHTERPWPHVEGKIGNALSTCGACVHAKLRSGKCRRAVRLRAARQRQWWMHEQAPHHSSGSRGEPADNSDSSLRR